VGSSAVDDVGLDGLRFSLDRERRLRRHLEQTLHQAIGGLSDEDTANRGALLHARGEIDCVAHRRVFHAQVGACLANNNQPGVDTYPHVEAADATFGFQVSGVFLRSSDDLQCGADRTLGVVLVRQRCAEESQNRVAHQARERALVPGDGRDEELKCAVHDFQHLFWVEGLRHGSRTFDIREEDGHQPAFGLSLPLCSEKALNIGLGYEATQHSAGIRACRGRLKRCQFLA